MSDAARAIAIDSFTPADLATDFPTNEIDESRSFRLFRGVTVIGIERSSDGSDLESGAGQSLFPLPGAISPVSQKLIGDYRRRRDIGRVGHPPFQQHAANDLERSRHRHP